MCYQVCRRPRADNALQMRPGAACLASRRRGAKRASHHCPGVKACVRPIPFKSEPTRLAIWSAAGFNFVIAIGQRLPDVVADNEAGAVVVDGPGRREMTSGHGYAT